MNMSTSASGHLTAPPHARPRSASNAPSCNSDLTTIEDNDDCDLEKSKLVRQQTFVVDTDLSFLDLLKGMIWRTSLKRKIEESVKPAYSKMLDEEMFDHDRSPYDLDVHVSPKYNSTRYKTTRCWFDTGCFQGNIVSKDIVEELGYDESDYAPLSTREQLGGKTMNGTIHTVEAAILLSWHHNTGPKFRDMRFLISPTLDSTMIIGARSIVKYSIMSPPVFMSLDGSTKQYHKPLSEDKEHIELSHARGEVDRTLVNLTRNIKLKKTSEDRRKLEEEKIQVTRKRDMLSLRLEIRETELNKVMDKAKKDKHIEQLRKQLVVAEHGETETPSQSPNVTPKVVAQ